MGGIGRRKMKGGDEVDYNLVKNFKIKNQKKNKQRAILFSHTTVQIRSTDTGGLKYNRKRAYVKD